MRRPAAVLAIALLLAACSNDTDTAPATSTATAATAPAASSSATTTIAATTTSEAATTTTVAGARYAATIDELLGLGRPIVLAHTAGEDEYPASTMYGFSESVKANVDMLDLNVQLSKDGVLVVHHDDTVDRATNGTGAVADLTFAQLAALDDAFWFTDQGVTSDQPAAAYRYRGIRTGAVPPPAGYTADDFAIPSFRELVKRFPDIPLNIEIKGTGAPAKAAADELARELDELGRADASVVASFDDEIVSYFHSIAPNVEVSPGLDVLTKWVLDGTPVPDGMRILQLPPEYNGLTVITPKLVADSTAAGYPIWVWPNDRSLENYESYRDFLDIGIAGLNINFPGQGVQAVTDATAVAATPSKGCATSAVSAEAHTTLDFTAAGQAGTYIRALPTGYDGTTPMPLVIDLHGYSESATIHEQFSGLGTYGDAHRFVTVTPDITRPVPRWDIDPNGADVQWLTALLEELESALCIDTARVYAAGLSNGAMMTSQLGCVLSDRLAAIGPVAGVLYPDGCTANHMPVVAIHGTADRFLPYGGGVGPAVSTLPSPDDSGGTLGSVPAAVPVGAVTVPESMAMWAAADGCGSDSTEQPVSADTTAIRWPCDGHAPVVLYRVDGGGHAWPGSAFSASLADVVGFTTMTVDANTLLWRFFRQHTLA